MHTALLESRDSKGQTCYYLLTLKNNKNRRFALSLDSEKKSGYPVEDPCDAVCE